MSKQLNGCSIFCFCAHLSKMTEAYFFQNDWNSLSYNKRKPTQFWKTEYVTGIFWAKYTLLMIPAETQTHTLVM